MPMSLHAATVPTFRQTLASMSTVLDMAKAHCDENNIDHAEFLGRSLAPDMFTLGHQFQRATFHAAQIISKLTQTDTPAFAEADLDANFEAIQARLAETRDYIAAAKPEQFDGSEDREVEIRTRIATLTFTGQDFLLHFGFPQFFFHCTTAYDIIRNAGIEVGKRHFLGDPATR